MKQWIDSFIRRVRDTSTVVAIGPAGDPIWHRYFVIPRNRFFNIYLHRFRHSDEQDLHDHRMANISLVLQGWYYEVRFVEKPIAGQPLPETRRYLVKPMRPQFRRATTPHRIVLDRELGSGKEVAVWSLFIGFPRVRSWGFWRSINGRACWVPHECREDYREAA